MKATMPWTASAALGVALCVANPALGGDNTSNSHATEQSAMAECTSLLEGAGARRAMQLVQAQLLAQGMKLVVQGCPFVRSGAGDMRQVLDVRVQVVNSEVAADFVRGPLADGEEADMGGVHLDAPRPVQGLAQPVAHAPQEDISPDVVFNRQWLVQVMQRTGWQAVSGYWWAYVPTVAAH